MEQEEIKSLVILKTIKISKYPFLVCVRSTLHSFHQHSGSGTVRNSPTLLEFKTKLRNEAQKDKASGILSIGKRKLIIILTRIRHNCSNLNADLHIVNIVPSPL